MKKMVKSALLAFSLSLPAALTVLADDRPVTPYGGYCKDCAVYGACKEPIKPGEAVRSLRKYYEERGCRLGIVSHKGRFIEAEIFRDGKMVDKVVFDRKTGRLRSIY